MRRLGGGASCFFCFPSDDLNVTHPQGRISHPFPRSVLSHQMTVLRCNQLQHAAPEMGPKPSTCSARREWTPSAPLLASVQAWATPRRRHSARHATRGDHPAKIERRRSRKNIPIAAKTLRVPQRSPTSPRKPWHVRRTKAQSNTSALTRFKKNRRVQRRHHLPRYCLTAKGRPARN